jgi:hypothetical protein
LENANAFLENANAFLENANAFFLITDFSVFFFHGERTADNRFAERILETPPLPLPLRGGERLAEKFRQRHSS